MNKIKQLSIGIGLLFILLIFGLGYYYEDYYEPKQAKIAEELNKPVWEYIEIEESLRKDYNNSFGDSYDVEITLLKVGRVKTSDSWIIRPYWKVENKGKDEFSIHPHQNTIIIAGQTQYNTDFFNAEDMEDDFNVGGSTGGDLRSGVIAQGGVNIENIPLNTTTMKIILETTWLKDFEFEFDMNKFK